MFYDFSVRTEKRNEASASFVFSIKRYVSIWDFHWAYYASVTLINSHDLHCTTCHVRRTSLPQNDWFILISWRIYNFFFERENTIFFSLYVPCDWLLKTLQSYNDCILLPEIKFAAGPTENRIELHITGGKYHLDERENISGHEIEIVRINKIDAHLCWQGKQARKILEAR